ncbi:hypothetical protein PROFUN_14840 [Planoprotostelium fungivorum]|uniref:Uncharacterized protein n=1 Tax=Planoprotostelium fungivorum TaxID=1890364 RepID=A0A2P6MYK1_9EUKA|nr:hypothetical protein PROFUN_14840 [Planoprotostelium fungivorum]
MSEHLNKGISLFESREYKSAKESFEAVLAEEPNNTTAKTWLRKCHAELGETGQSTTALFTQAGQPKIRHEWYQTMDHLMISILAKGTKKEEADIRLSDREVNIIMKLPTGSEYMQDFHLAADIEPSQCTINHTPNKVELKLKKKKSSQWKSLEEVGTPAPSVAAPEPVSTVEKSNTHKPKKNWDKIVSSEEPEQEGDALNKVFQDIFANGTDEQKRAMMKSFTESGGTVLSTNWAEVGSKTVKGTPPKGMEMHSWTE